MRDERAAHTGVLARLAAAAMASLTCWHFSHGRESERGFLHMAGTNGQAGDL